MVRPLAAIGSDRRGPRVEPRRIGVRTLEGLAARACFEQDALQAGARPVGGFVLEIERLDQTEASTLSATLRNASAQPLRIESVIFGFVYRGHGAHSLRFLRHGWQSWSRTRARPLDEHGQRSFPSGPWLRGLHHSRPESPAERSGWHESELIGLVAAAPEGPACLVGALESGLCSSVVYLRRCPEGGGRGECALEIEIEQTLEVWLEPGESRRLEAVRVALDADPNRLLERFAELWGNRTGARRTAPFQIGWCSWYHFFHDVSESDVLRNLEALAADREGLPVDLIQLDDGYQRALGDWLQTNERFPRGLAPLAAEIRSAGFRAGLWTAPFAASAESELLSAHPDWPLRAGDGWLRGTFNPAWSRDGWCYVLDPSREDVRAHLRALFQTLVEWGFDYLKLDFLYMAGMSSQAADPGLTRAARLRAGLQAIRDGAGEKAFLLGCGCPFGPAVGLVDGMRIGPDVAPSWQADSAQPIAGLEGTEPSTRDALHSILARAFMQRRLWRNDPDCLMLRRRGTQLAPEESHTLAAVIAATGGMLLFSDDVPELGADERRMLRESAAVAREVDAMSARGVARVLRPLADDGPRVLLASAGRDALVTVSNLGEDRLDARIDWSELGCTNRPARMLEVLAAAPPPDRHCAVEVDASETGIALGLPAHASALLRLEGARRPAVFCDFDGTFTRQDVGSTLARRHLGARRQALWQRFERGEVEPWDYLAQLFEGFEFGPEELDRFLAESIELDVGASALVAWCGERRVPLTILSDGFDHNLERLQAMHGLRFEYRANRLHFEGARWHLSPGGRSAQCGCGTGCCKREAIREYRRRSPGAYCVHVGNGRVSDLCGALEADLVFAKDTLAPALAERGVFFLAYETLNDVVSALSERL